MAAGNKLLSTGHMENGSLSWRISSDQGLSHGASGFAICFAQLFNVSKLEKFGTAVEQILSYERQLYNSEQGNWLDLRKYVNEQSKGKEVFSIAWAHGAPGIGLARLKLINLGFDNDGIRGELEKAVYATLSMNLESKHTLNRA